MLSLETANCPECDGAYDRENYAVVCHADCTQKHLLCTFCGLGWFVEEYPDGTDVRIPYHRRSAPVSFAKFCARLKKARKAGRQEARVA